MRRMNQTPPPLLPQSNDDRRCLSRRSLLTTLGLGLIGLGGISAQAASARRADAYVSALKVREQTDGVGPFDDDDEPGDDSSATNLIVRSFDSVNYLLEYTTELTDKEHPVKGAVRLVATFTLPMDPRRARFDAQALNWAVEGETTYVYADGTRSKTWDKSRTVTQQIFTAVRLLEGKGTDDRVPGAGQLSVGVLVYAAVQGERVLPTFALNVEGDSRRVACQPKAVAVSSRPRLNVRLTRYAQSMNRRGYFDFETGDVHREDAEGLVLGRHEGYALSLRLHNTSADKALRGLELPMGPITFDLRASTAISRSGGAETDVSDDPEWAPLFWDWRESEYGDLHTKGVLRRDMAPYEYTQSYPCWTEFYNGGDNANSCHDGGEWSIERDAVDDDLYHITVSGYSFDLDDFSFPVTYPGHSSKHVDATANIGCFSAAYAQFVAQHPREVDGTINYYLRMRVENFHAATETVSDVTEQQVATDDFSSFTVPLYSGGAIDKYVQFSSIPGGRTGNALTWNSGDGYGPPGAKSRVLAYLIYTGDGAITAWNALVKFDDELMRVPEADSFEASPQVYTAGSEKGRMRVLFAAKPDGSGWDGQDEMNRTPEEGLVFFGALEELEASGRTCVGVLAEVRRCRVYGGRDSAASVERITVWMRDDAEPGRVAAVVDDVRAWMGDEQPMSWSDLAPAPDGHYGDGSAGMTHGAYIDGYAKPYADVWREYVPSRYEDGALVGGHTGGVRWGDSALVVGAKNGVSIAVADRAGDRPKTTYDLDANERTATFKVQPMLTVASSSMETPGVDMSCDLTVEVRLPVGLAYDDRSGSREPDGVVENDDGTQTVTWTVPNARVGEGVDPITFTCTIGAAGTDHDVDNNQQLTVEARITSDLDQREASKDNGNLSETAIVCVRLAAISVFKSVAPVHANPDEPHVWTLRFGNSSETDVTEVGLVDTMPYPGDDRGSAFFGTYTVRSLALDLTSAPKLLADIGDAPDEVLWITSDAFAREVGDDAMLSDGSVVARTFIGRPDRVSGGVLTWELGLDLSDIVAWGLVFDAMHGPEYLTVTLEVEPKGAASGDVYANSFTENALGQAAIVHSNVVKTDVESVSFTVEKVWDGINGVTGRPAVTVAVIGSDGSETMLTCDEDNGWTASVEDLDRYAADGSRIAYTVEERDVPDGYELVGIEGSDAKGFRITNRALTGTSAGAKRPSHESWL